MLYIVGTPIGNLNDISKRAVESIFSSDILLVEDTRSFGIFYQLLKKKFPSITPQLNQRMISFHKQNEFQRLGEIIDCLNTNKNVSLISESGMPGIADPGNLLINQCVTLKIPFSVIPGPSAFTTALIYSGFNYNNALFIGFFPKQKSLQLQYIKTWKRFSVILNKNSFVIVFYESPHRLNETLQLLANEFANAHFCVCREMSKKFEEIVRFDSQHIPKREWKGEITIVIKVT